MQHIKKEIEALKSQAQQKQERIEEQRERILAEAREKANTILRDAKDVADETIKNFRKFGKENISAAEMEKERERLRKKMKENTASSSLKVQKPKKEYKPTDFKLGESVKVLSMNLTGTISSLPDSPRKCDSADGNFKISGSHFQIWRLSKRRILMHQNHSNVRQKAS